MNKYLILLMTLITVSTSCTQAQSSPIRNELLKAMNECTDYAVNILLDEEGKSRCDYNLVRGEWFPYEEPWHTGQIILGLVDVYEITRNETALAAARRAGDWWIGMEIKDHPKLKGMVAATHGDVVGNNQIVFATISDGTHGIYELSRVTGDQKYARVATGAATRMLENMYYPEEGVCYDLVDLATGEILKQDSPFHWDKEIQSLEDVSRPNTEGSPFKDAYLFTKEERFKEAHLLLCNSLIEKQNKDGIWMDYMPNHKKVSSFHPRFNLWYAESLLEAYELTGDKKYLEAAAKTARTYAKAQRADGTLYYDNYTDGKPSDKGSVYGSAIAFAGILWIRLAEYGYDEFIPHYEKSIAWILKNQYAMDHPDPNLRGAVVNTRMHHRKGEVWLTQRDVGTSFGLRFMAAYYNLRFNN
ncbi:MAG: glycoside hydrolase family 127 protein [Bacteroides sp.]|nr:glycoside hydrolase family 127 protein [Bacteroides sp.]